MRRRGLLVLKRVKVGTCGFSKSRRAIYRDLDVVEIQQTFYDPRVPGFLERIRGEAPEGFEFTVKAWMLVTHQYNKRLWNRLKSPVPGGRGDYGFFKDNEAVRWAWRETVKAAETVGARIILLQSPASFKPTGENMSRLESFLSKYWPEGYRLAWEPRGEWWDSTGVLDRMREEYGLIIVGDVLRGRMPPGRDLLYTRLHGLGGREVNYKYKYTDVDLERLKRIVLEGGWRDSYVLFNNIYSYDDAVRFKKLMASLHHK